MNKQIEQVETIMTEYAERECISKEKENQTGTGFKQFFFQVMQEEMENKSIQ